MATTRILVGVDGSPHALRALDFAAELAARLEASLLLVAVAPPLLAPVDHAAGPARLDEEQRTRAQQALGDAVQRGGSRGLRLEPVMLVSHDVVQALADVARAPDVALVAVGRRGRGEVASLLLGSVSNRLARTCTKPVVVVP